MADRTYPIAERYPLGRHVQHDPRSMLPQYRAFTATTLVTARHDRHCDAFDQGELGSCTGNAMAGALMTDPLWRDGWAFTENDAVRLYSLATTLDPFPGAYPPADTGSSGLAVAQAAMQEGYIQWYGHAFGLDEALRALVLGPIIIGINWYSSFDFPSKGGVISIRSGAYVRGGHEVVLDRINVSKRQVSGMNSWGVGWSVGGRFWMGWGTFDRLLREQGDATQFLASA